MLGVAHGQIQAPRFGNEAGPGGRVALPEAKLKRLLDNQKEVGCGRGRKKVPAAERLDPGFEVIEIVLLVGDVILEIADAEDEGPGFLPLRGVEDSGRRPFLVNDALVHVEDAAGDVSGEPHLMGDDGHGHAVGGQAADDAQHLAHHRRVESRGRLVEEDDLGIHRQATGDGHALLLAAGQLVGESIFPGGQPDQGEQAAGPRFRLPARFPQELHRADRQIVQHGHVFEEVEILEDHSHFPPQGVGIVPRIEDVPSVHPDMAAGRTLQQVQAAEKRALARARRPDDRDDLAPLDLSVDILQDDGLSEALGQVLDPDQDVARAGGRTGSFHGLLLFGLTRTRIISRSEVRPQARMK